MIGFCCFTILALQANAAVALDQTLLADWGPLVVHFDKNKTDLSEGDKAKVRELLRQYDLGDVGRIFVVGYTDSTGAKDYNYKLSRRRAERVRRSIISVFDLSPQKIIAVGKGPESPLADNKKKTGRARNRRAEIYLSHAVNRALQDKYHQADPHLETVDILLTKARQELLQGELPAALSTLKKAQAVGADRFSQWHSLYAVAGFLTDTPLQTIKAHLETALLLDAENFEAQAFLGRVEAREKVSAGQVTAAMGRSAADAIEVISMEQQHEYLNLFDVEPLYHHEMQDAPIDVWECRNLQQQPVAYYFNRSQVYTRHFDVPPAKITRPFPFVSPAHAQVPASDSAGPETPVPSAQSSPQDIWQSKLFK
jgi:hypothetical protein